jgi:hypothetical protein
VNAVRKDPLLIAAKVLLYAFIALFIFAMAMVAIGIGALLTVGQDDLAAALAEAGAPARTAWAIIGLMLMAEVLFLLILRFCLELRRIVLSVDEGDPFRPENARRLSRMGWLSLAGWALLIPIGVLAAWIGEVTEGIAQNDVDVSADLNGLLLALVLFILARVFRQGALLREDVEGTI